MCECVCPLSVPHTPSAPQTESYRRLMLIEMTLRVVKNEIRATLRKAIFEHPLSEEPARRAITPILNRVMAVSDDSAAYWTELKDRVRTAPPMCRVCVCV